MTRTANKEIHKLWRTAAAVVTAASIYLAGAPHSAAQLEGNPKDWVTEPLPPCTTVGVPGFSTAATTGPAAFLEQHSSCLSTDEIKTIVGRAPTPELLKRLSQISEVAGHKPKLMTQPDAITLARKANGLIQLHVISWDPSTQIRPTGREMFGFNPDPNAKDSVKNMLLKHEITHGREHIQSREKDFSIAWTVFPSQLGQYTFDMLKTDTRIFSDNYQALLHIQNSKLVTAEGKIDVAKLSPDLKDIGAKLQAHMDERHWAILPHQPPLAMQHPPFFPAQLAAFDIAAYPPKDSGYGYIFVGIDDHNIVKRWPNKDIGRRYWEIVNAFYYYIPDRYAQHPLPDPTSYSNVMKLAESIRAATAATPEQAHAVTPAQIAPTARAAETQTPAPTDTARGSTAPSAPRPLTTEEMNDIRHIRRSIAEMLGIHFNQVMGMFQNKAGYVGPVVTGAEQILPPIADADRRKFFDCYKDPSCYARKSGKGAHKDWGFKEPPQTQATPHKQSFVPPSSFPQRRSLPPILTAPHGQDNLARLLAPYRKHRPEAGPAAKKLDR